MCTKGTHPVFPASISSVMAAVAQATSCQACPSRRRPYLQQGGHVAGIVGTLGGRAAGLGKDAQSSCSSGGHFCDGLLSALAHQDSHTGAEASRCPVTGCEGLPRSSADGSGGSHARVHGSSQVPVHGLSGRWCDGHCGAAHSAADSRARHATAPCRACHRASYHSIHRIAGGASYWAVCCASCSAATGASTGGPDCSDACGARKGAALTATGSGTGTTHTASHA